MYIALEIAQDTMLALLSAGKVVESKLISINY